MPGAFAGYYLDGRSAARQQASVRLSASGLEIALEDGTRLWWPFRNVRQTQGFYAGEQIRLERGSPFSEILLVDDTAFLGTLHATAPGFGRRFHNPRRRRSRVLLTIGAALTSVAVGAVLYVWGIPAAAGLLASRVPVSWEDRLGQAAVEQITASKRRCVDQDREEAIGAIVQRLLDPQPKAPYTFRMIVVDDWTVNAFAVPGGQIVLLRGLLERSRTPEELAGVLAHELQHVLQRHATRLLLQHASTGLLLVAISGDITGAMAYGIESARVLGTLRYSRHLESEADVEGLRMLLAADVDPRGMIAFFETLRGAERGAPTASRYLASHPLAADRVETLERLAAAHTKGFRPLLPGRDWADLRRVCGG
jgi:Zn-dependent protease with chaperone function